MTARIDIASCRKALAERLRDTRGFMIGEQLISIIFIGLLCIAVAAGLHAAMNSYSKITLQTQADAMLLNAVEVVSDELVYALEVEGSGDMSDENPLYFTSATRHETAALQTREDGIWLNCSVQALLAPAKDGLVPKLASLSYGTLAGTWTFHIAVNSGDRTLAETTMTVKRIGS